MEDDKLLGERMFDAIENGAVGSMQWLQRQAEDDPDRYTDDMLRLLGGGVKNVGWALSKVPFLDKIAQGEDWLAGKAREMSEELTPQLDPRFAGWGTRIGTGILADKGIGKATGAVTKGVKAYKAVSKADEIMAAAKTKDLGLQMMAQVDNKIPKFKRGLPTPEKTYKNILDDIIEYPSLEQLNSAVTGSGRELKSNWKYKRQNIANTPLKSSKRVDWSDIGARLKREGGGTDAQVEAFIQRQVKARKTIETDIKALNQQFHFNFLQLALTEVDSVFGKAMGKAVRDAGAGDDIAFRLFNILAEDSNKYPIFELGHIQSAKNVYRAQPNAFAGSADFVTNLRPEIKRSIRDLFGNVIEPGNIKRGANEDLPKLVNMMMDVSPNIDIEYKRFLGDYGIAMDMVVPPEYHEHFVEYLRKNIKKWQGVGPKRKSGKLQLKGFNNRLRRAIDDYLNKLNEGKFIDDDLTITKGALAEEDFRRDLLRSKLSGEDLLDRYNAENNAIKKIMPKIKDVEYK